MKVFEQAKGVVVEHSVLSITDRNKQFFVTVSFNRFAYAAGLF